MEVAGSGVTCNAICPGYVETPRKLFIVHSVLIHWRSMASSAVTFGHISFG